MMATDEDIVELLVVGGGINGAGVAADAAGRGLRVALVEQDDLASATSSASSKLIHGGLRYLEYYKFRLVRESLKEREVLLSKAPHIIRPMRFVLPHRHQLRPAWMIRLGLYLYDHLARHPRLPGSSGMDLEADPWGKPLKDGIKRGFVYSDCWVDDARLVILNAMAAAENGARIWPRTRLVTATRQNGLWDARLEDLRTGVETALQARALVNAAGPWVQDVLENRIGEKSERKTRLVKGSHIVVNKIHEGDHAYILQQPDGRVVFVLPFEDEFSLIGTTDVPVTGGPETVQGITADEVTYLCLAVNGYFEAQLTPSDVVWSFSGVRPLFGDEAESPSAITRDYALDLDGEAGRAPLVSVFGGKITTYRRLAEQVMDNLRPFLPDLGPAWTAGAPLPGGDIPGGDVQSFAAGLAENLSGLDSRYLLTLCRRYGTRTPDVLKGARTMDDLGTGFGDSLTAREVDYLVEHEWAETAEDILWRRTKAGLKMDDRQQKDLEDYMMSPETAKGPTNGAGPDAAT